AGAGVAPGGGCDPGAGGSPPGGGEGAGLDGGCGLGGGGFGGGGSEVASAPASAWRLGSSPSATPTHRARTVEPWTTAIGSTARVLSSRVSAAGKAVGRRAAASTIAAMAIPCRPRLENESSAVCPTTVPPQRARAATMVFEGRGLVMPRTLARRERR